MFHASDKPQSIDPRLLTRGFTPEQLKMLQDRVKEEVTSNEIISLNTRITGELRRFNYPEFDYVINLHYVYSKAGVLPYPGATSEQPAKIIEIFSILDQLNSERQREEMSKVERKKKNGRY